MRLPWLKPSIETRKPRRGITLAGERLDAPAENASDEQWFDFAALLGLLAGIGLSSSERYHADHWQTRLLRAYKNKWRPLDGKVPS